MPPIPPALAALVAVAEHLGTLHAHERLLVLLVAFGPFVVLALVVRAGRRRALAEDAGDPGDVERVDGEEDQAPGRQPAKRS